MSSFIISKRNRNNDLKWINLGVVLSLVLLVVYVATENSIMSNNRMIQEKQALMSQLNNEIVNLEIKVTQLKSSAYLQDFANTSKMVSSSGRVSYLSLDESETPLVFAR